MVIGNDGTVGIDDEARALGLHRLGLLRLAETERKARWQTGKLRETRRQAVLVLAVVAVVIRGVIHLQLHIHRNNRRHDLLYQAGKVRHRGEVLLHGLGGVQRRGRRIGWQSVDRDKRSCAQQGAKGGRPTGMI